MFLTGAVGDVDGDGELDMIAIVDNHGEINTEEYHKIRVVKINMAEAVRTRGRLAHNLDMYVAEPMRSAPQVKPIENSQFRPVSQQPWTQYIGKKSDGIYRE